MRKDRDVKDVRDARCEGCWKVGARRSEGRKGAPGAAACSMAERASARCSSSRLCRCTSPERTPPQKHLRSRPPKTQLEHHHASTRPTDRSTAHLASPRTCIQAFCQTPCTHGWAARFSGRTGAPGDGRRPSQRLPRRPVSPHSRHGYAAILTHTEMREDSAAQGRRPTANLNCAMLRHGNRQATQSSCRTACGSRAAQTSRFANGEGGSGWRVERRKCAHEQCLLWLPRCDRRKVCLCA